MTARPRCMSSWSSRRAGAASRASIDSRLPAIDLIGASELLISWPMTRIRRCHAWRSSSRSGRLTSASTSSWCGRPPCRNVVRRTSQRPGRRGTRRPRCAASAPSRQPRESELARRCGRAAVPPAARAGARRRGSPAERCAPSKAKTATSISAITVRSSAVASSAPSRWSCSVTASTLTSSITAPSGSSPLAPRARIEKSLSRSAASRFDSVCSGSTTRWRTLNEQPVQTPTMNTSASTALSACRRRSRAGSARRPRRGSRPRARAAGCADRSGDVRRGCVGTRRGSRRVDSPAITAFADPVGPD